MRDIYVSREWTYKIKGSFFRRARFIARNEKTLNEMVRLVSKITDKPPTRLVSVRLVYINKPPYEQEQEMLEWFREQCIKKGVDPYEQ